MDAGADACTPAAAGFALSFGGTEYVSVPDSPLLHLTSAMTIEAWISEQATGLNCIVCKPYQAQTSTYDSVALWFQGPLYFGFDVPSTASALSVAWGGSTGTWHHVAATFDGTSQVLFIDGVQAGTQTSGSGVPTYDTTPLLIGMDINNGAYNLGFQGTIDEVRIYNAARSAAQIVADMVGGCSPERDPSLVAYYPFNEGTGNVAHDATQNHLDGTLGLPDGGGGTVPTWITSTVTVDGGI